MKILYIEKTKFFNYKIENFILFLRNFKLRQKTNFNKSEKFNLWSHLNHSNVLFAWRKTQT